MGLLRVTVKMPMWKILQINPSENKTSAFSRNAVPVGSAHIGTPQISALTYMRC